MKLLTCVRLIFDIDCAAAPDARVPVKVLVEFICTVCPCTELFKKQKTNTNYLDPQGGKKDKDLKSSGTEAIGERRTRLLQRREP